MVDEVIYHLEIVQVTNIDQDEERTSNNNDVTSFSFGRHKHLRSTFRTLKRKKLPTTFAPL
jgi:hypothetical protein